MIVYYLEQKSYISAFEYDSILDWKITLPHSIIINDEITNITFTVIYKL